MDIHLHDELLQNPARVVVETQYGPVTGGRATNGATAFLEVPYALPPGRFEDPKPLPPHFRYEEKEYVRESAYAVQPTNDGQHGDLPYQDKVGLGSPSENPLFVNIISPPSFPSTSGFPVKIYIHGGFLQFGSPHSLGSQAQYIAAERSEVWVNIGYRLSAFGFLACDQPRLEGNYGFKDQWLALEWVKANIGAFGGNADDLQVTGLSAGAHSVHQLLHHASRLSHKEQAPFHSAVLQSNAILTNPKTPTELRPQFHALCRALNLGPDGVDTLSTLRDPSKISWKSITHLIETDALGTEYGTFRGCLDGSWLASSPDPMAWQRTGGFGKGLRENGIRSVIMGDLTDEWYLYSIAHPILSPRDIVPNLERYYSEEIVKRMVGMYRTLPEDAESEQARRLFGEILSNAQVHLPVRLLVRDLQAAGFPAFRYEIRWTPEQSRPEGYVTHATDRSLWTFRVQDPDHQAIARSWLHKFSSEVKKLEDQGNALKGLTTIMTLKEDKTILWTEDTKWDDLMKLSKILPGETKSKEGV